MAIDNEELMQKFVRTGMIMRHIDGEGGCCRKHGHGHGHGHAHGHHGEGEGRCCHGHDEAHAARYEMGEGVEHPHGPHGHGPLERPSDGSECHGHGHRHGHGHGRRHGQARVLTMVSMQEGINQKDLAFLLGIRPQTLGEMLRKMEENGLVERKRSEADARAIQVTLTDEGRSRAAEIAERRKVVAADMFAVLSDEEKGQLATILDKLGDELDKHRPKRHCKHAGDGETVRA